MVERDAGRIAAVTVESTRIATVRDHQMAIGTTRFQENVLVRVFTEDGTVGFGEAPHMVGHSQAGETPGTVRVVLRDKLVPAALGLNAFDHEALSAALDRAVPGNLRAKGALAMAAYDLAGKLLGAPVHDLLGGRCRASIPLSWSLPIVALEDVVREAEVMVERGWRILKIKAGRPDPMDDVRVVAAVRAAVGDGIRLRADANQAYSVKDARRVIAGMAEHGLEFMEQPTATHDLAGLAEVARSAPVPVMADETADTPEAVAAIGAARAADSVSIYVIGPGSLGRSKKMADIAGAFGMRGYIGGALESIIGASAGLHVAAASPAVDLGCEMTGQYLLEQDIGTERLEMRDGDLVVPTGPGLGVELDEEVIERHRVGEVERHGAALEIA
jgi:L-alanine-DL-glutamate epimerase-like enolase superfamily enzyme